MDPRSIAGSISGVLGIADGVFSRTFKYAVGMKETRKDIHALSSEIGSLAGVLHRLHLLADALEEQPIETSIRLQHINACRETLSRIERILDQNDPDKSKHKAIGPALRMLKWPFSVAETNSLLHEMARHRATIDTALAVDNLTAMLKALSRQDEMQERIVVFSSKLEMRWANEDARAENENRQKVLDFFQPKLADPRPRQRKYLQMRSHLTGLWFTEGHVFRNWLHTKGSKLWLTGMPGAGKTVLAASSIEQAFEEIEVTSEARKAVAYFYCDYKIPTTQQPVNILGSIAVQLAQQNVNAFGILLDHFKDCHPKEKLAASPDTLDPSIMVEKVRQMALAFDEVSIIIDALEECGAHVVDVIDCIITLPSSIDSNIRLLLLSRDEYDIRNSLPDEYTRFEIAAHSADIEIYVAAELETRARRPGRERLRIESPELKNHIMRTLVDRAQGMFRWVTCQIDYLCRLPTDSEKRKALDKLPPGLYDTYDRILEDVHKADDSMQFLVKMALEWVVGSPTALTSPALSEALAIRGSAKHIEKESMPNEDYILTYCSSLIRLSRPSDRLSFLESAHFTVNEYLTSERLKNTAILKFYHIDREALPVKLGTRCLTYLNLQDFSDRIPEDYNAWVQSLSLHPFRMYAVCHWPRFAKDRGHERGLLDGAERLFAPRRSTNFISWLRDYCLVDSPDVYDGGYDFSNFSVGTAFADIDLQLFSGAGSLTPLHAAAMLGLTELCQWLLDMGSDSNRSGPLGTPLHCALLGESTSIAYKHDIYSTEFSPTRASRDVVRILLDSGANSRTLYHTQDGMHQRTCIELALRTYDSGKKEGLEDLLPLLLANVEALTEADLQMINSCSGHFSPRLSSILQNDPSLREVRNRLSGLPASNTITLPERRRGFDSNLVSFSAIRAQLFQFHSAVKYNQKTMVESFLERHNVNLDMSWEQNFPGLDAYKVPRFDDPFDREGCSPPVLHAAVFFGSLGVVETLLNKGADVTFSDADGKSPLHYAAVSKSSEVKSCILMLLDHGAGIAQTDLKGLTAMHEAASAENLRALEQFLLCQNSRTIAQLMTGTQESQLVLEKGARKQLDSMAVVHFVMLRNNLDMLRLLHKHEVDLRVKSCWDETALHFVSPSTPSSLVELLLDSGLRTTDVDSVGNTPLNRLLLYDSTRHPKVVQLLSDGGAVHVPAKNGRTALHTALQSTSFAFQLSSSPLQAVVILLEKHANPLANDLLGRSPLTELIVRANASSYYIKRTVTPIDLRTAGYLFEQILDKINDPKILDSFHDPIGLLSLSLVIKRDTLTKRLLDAMLDVNTRDMSPEAYSPLEHACLRGCNQETFQTFVTRTKRLDTTNSTGYSALHCLCFPSSGCKPSYVSLLLEAGANPDIIGKHGNTPLILATKSAKPQHVEILLQHGANTLIRDAAGWTCFHWALIGDQEEILHKLNGTSSSWDFMASIHPLGTADFVWRDCTALHFAASSPCSLRFLFDNFLVRDVDCTASMGDTPLHYAALLGNVESIEILLSNGASVGVRSEKGDSPMDYCIRYGRIAAAQRLFELGSEAVKIPVGRRAEDLAVQFGLPVSCFRDGRVVGDG